MRLRPIRTGLIPINPGYVFRSEAGNLLEALGRGVPEDAKLVSPIGAFLIEHPAQGPVLVDTGMHAITATEPRRNLGPIGALVLKDLRIAPGENVPDRLRAWGLAPEQVGLVVMTHLHADHTSAMSQFPGATFVTTPAEWKAARGRLGGKDGYIRGHLPPQSKVQLVDFRDGRPFDGLDRTIDLLGDGTIRLVSPGHTVGHLSVLVETERGAVFVLGDAVYTLRNLHEDILPWRTADDDASSDSMRQLRAYAAKHPGVPLIPTHDAQAWDDLLGELA